MINITILVFTYLPSRVLYYTNYKFPLSNDNVAAAAAAVYTKKESKKKIFKSTSGARR